MSDSAAGLPLRVLRVYHSGVVTSWRARERELRALGVEVALVTAKRWNEGGADVELAPDGDDFTIPLRTIGRHPNLFVYDPIGLWRALRDHRFDVLDIHEEPVSVAAAEVQLVAWLAGRRAPFCLYSAQNIDKRYPIPFRWMERIALGRAAAVHTCNEAAGKILRRKGFRGIVCNLGLGVDVSCFAPREHACDNSSLRVGYVGRLERHKGVNVLIDAVARVPACTLDIVGDGPERSALDHQIAGLGSARRVALVGYLSQAGLPALYHGFDVLAIPSLETPSWIEQFGRVAVEAMAAGVPVVASNSGSLPEVIGNAGVLVPPGDVGALARALEQLADAHADRLRLGKCARERAEHYTWGNIANRQFDLYRHMVTRAL